MFVCCGCLSVNYDFMTVLFRCCLTQQNQDVHITPLLKPQDHDNAHSCLRKDYKDYSHRFNVSAIKTYFLIGKINC